MVKSKSSNPRRPSANGEGPRGAKSNHVDTILDSAAKAYRLGKVELAQDLLGHLREEHLTPEQVARRDRALQILREG